MDDIQGSPSAKPEVSSSPQSIHSLIVRGTGWGRFAPMTTVLVLTFLAYIDTLWFKFIYDDRALILQNYFIRSWSYLPRYFAAHAWAIDATTSVGNYYRPLLFPWLRINYLLFGLEPAGWHLFSVLAHVGVTLLVYVLSVKLLGDPLTALAAAAIFGLHPAHIEAVAWISGSSESVLALLLISSFLCYLNWRTRPGRANNWLAASLLLYALAMLFKETALILPLAIFATEWCRPREDLEATERLRTRDFRRSLLAAAPYLLLTIPYLFARVVALKSFQYPASNVPVAEVFWTWPSLLWFYIQHLLWPVGLSGFYDLTYVVHPSFSRVFLPGVGVALIACGLYWWGKHSRQAALATAWMLLPLLPVLNIQVFGDGNFAHDRYLYLPSVGFSMLAALGLRRVEVGRRSVFGRPAIQAVLILVLSSVLGFGTVAQSLTYSSDARFYARCYVTAPHNDTVKANYASILGEQGRSEEALRLLQEILTRHPESSSVNYNVGYTYYRMGNLEEARRHLTRAVQLNPQDAEGFFYLGLTQLKMEHVDEAALDVRQAVTINPHADNYHFALGVIFKLQGNLAAALEEFRAELALNPNHSAARAQVEQLERPKAAPATVESPPPDSHSTRVPESGTRATIPPTNQ